MALVGIGLWLLATVQMHVAATDRAATTAQAALRAEAPAAAPTVAGLGTSHVQPEARVRKAVPPPVRPEQGVRADDETADDETAVDERPTVDADVATRDSPGGRAGAQPAPAPAVPYGQRVATITFTGGMEATYAVVEGTDRAALQKGPGRYMSSDMPGRGNFAVAGHRTTFGAPFGDIDRLMNGDIISVRDETGTSYTYAVIERRIVSPEDTWVIGPDPLERGRPLLTLTTCHPKYSARQRLIVWAELV